MASIVAAVVMLLAGLPLGTGTHSGDDAVHHKIEDALLDEAWLEEHGYISESGAVSVIIQLEQHRPIGTHKAAIRSILSENDYSYVHRYDLESVNAFSARLPIEALHLTAAQAAVDRVWLNGRLHAMDATSNRIIEVDEVWKHDGNVSEDSINDLPLKGEGTVVSIIDSGIWHPHPEFGSCDEGPIDYSTCKKIISGWDYIENESNVGSAAPHGTKVAGVVGAEGVELNGTSPNSRFLIYEVFDGTSDGTVDYAIDAIERSVDNNADVVSMSLGYRSKHLNGSEEWKSGDDILSQAVDDAVFNEGLVVVAAVGNKPEDSMPQSPASSQGAIAVGASKKDDTWWSGSTEGPTEDGRTKPELLAPTGVRTTDTFDELSLLFRVHLRQHLTYQQSLR